jgi:hypothetical protein
MDKLAAQNSRRKINPDTNLPIIPNKCYTVPIKKLRDGSLGINWALIDRVVEYTRHRLFEVKLLTTERNVIINKYGLEECLRQSHAPKRYNEYQPDCMCSAMTRPCRCDFEHVKS